MNQRDRDNDGINFRSVEYELLINKKGERNYERDKHTSWYCRHPTFYFFRGHKLGQIVDKNRPDK